ncbi:MAG: transposase [Methylophilus sp.]|nr:transposase [Methylophilus sp.]
MSQTLKPSKYPPTDNATLIRPTKMPDYRRNRVPGGTYFFTVNLLERRGKLLTENIDLLRAVVIHTQKNIPFHIDAWVVLPDHMHCVWTLPINDDDYPARWKAIKTAFSRALPKNERRSSVRMAKGERGIWQRRYWEHTIRSDKDYAAHIDYVHINPVKHGLVNQVKDWPYSTFHKLVDQGVYAEDWGGGIEGSLVYED